MPAGWTGTDADADRPTTCRNLSARPASTNMPEVKEDYLHIKQLRMGFDSINITSGRRVVMISLGETKEYRRLLMNS